MLPSFNTAGPCVPGEHYMLPPERRLGGVLRLIEERKYFTLRAGRQTGKTTSAMWLEDHLNESGRYRALWVDIQCAREIADPKEAFRTVLGAFESSFRRRFGAAVRPRGAEVDALLVDPHRAIAGYLEAISATPGPPWVLLLDEADGLVGRTMVSFLTQLREGYIARSRTPFPSTVALVGLREVRDYVLDGEDRRALSWLGTTSPFNITAEAQTLSPFGAGEVAEFLSQHNAVTGQRFDPLAVDRIYELARGHPWLTNALADQIVNRDVEDRSVTILAAHVDAAKETIILARRTHIDSLVARLREPRVRRILDPMLAGNVLPVEAIDDDLSYVAGLGIIRVIDGRWRIANPIYAEVIPRALNYAAQTSLDHPTEWYVRPDGGLDMPKLMAAWQKFWRIDGHVAAEGFSYKESGPHLMLMAFLQRVVNGGGRIEREYGLGKGALDLLVEWRTERHAIEVKLRRDTETEVEALDQLASYLDRLGLAEGWLVMFDLRATMAWSEKIQTRTIAHGARSIHIASC